MTGSRPALIARGEEALFYERLRQHELVYQYCQSCSGTIFYLRTRCVHCGSENLELRQSAGVGTVYSYTTQYRAANPHFSESVPYTLALVDLDEGFRVLGDLECEPSEAHVGMPVDLTFNDIDEDLTLMRFTLRTADTSQELT
ncbi:Zn-ribbon domain-containing OB-fold protein [Glaciibacter superstes]|uniref:Zn-ribbon domain-containing OB-fold protein n=1 Tax=Glaciibacter superstes TaxID=501023 RepID=UPI0003B5C013|nr:Zn-ribbon domain-containing OB-fold protein [Glaciibacter superstes]